MGGAYSRAMTADTLQIAADQADSHAVTLESILAVLRSRRLDDRAARTMATELAAGALVDLRTASDEFRDSLVEPVIGAFARLRNDLRPLVRHGDLDVQFVEPPATGRALPGEVADAVGYASPFSFSAAFRRHHGVTPSEVRRRAAGR
jgi:AraC-like DNA-binding protein